MTTLADKFTEFFLADEANDSRLALPGEQYLVQLLRGGHIDASLAIGKGRRALDVGTGNGFNLVTLDALGWDAFGVDIDERLLRKASKTLAKFNATATLAVGRSAGLPFEDGYFDLLLSANALHYAESDAEIHRNISEYARVLSPGGWLIVVTQLNSNWLLAGATKVRPNVYRIAVEDFRKGELIYAFESENAVAQMLDADFDAIKTGIRQIPLFEKTMIHVVASARRR